MIDRDRLGQIVHAVRVEYEKRIANADSSRLVPWEELNGWEKDLDQQIGERIAESVLSENNYTLSLAGVDPSQVVYNGKFSYLRDYVTRAGGVWCHLLVLRSKNKHSKQMIAIITQVQESAPIINFIARIATFVVNFFEASFSMTPENTIFVAYLPENCFGPTSGHEKETFAVIEFEWSKKTDASGIPYHLAARPDRHGTTRETINDLIERL